MLSQTERAQIAQLLQAPQWKALEHLIHTVAQGYEEEAIILDSEWDTLRSSLVKEGKKRGIQVLMQEIYNCLQQPKS